MAEALTRAQVEDWAYHHKGIVLFIGIACLLYLACSFGGRK